MEDGRRHTEERGGKEVKEPAGIHMNPSGAAWAAYYCAVNPGADEELMRSWFSNAMMAMHDYMESARSLTYATSGPIERLVLLAEECGEVIQVVGKILRHGYGSTHPAGGANNRELLEEELGHVRAAETIMLAAGDVDGAAIKAAHAGKLERINEYLHANWVPPDPEDDEARLAEAEKVIDSASTDFCSNMSEYKQKDCTEIPLLEFDWCTHCMAMAYRMKYPKA